MSDVLAGIRVVEVADWGFVPSAATVLGDWGAEVVKIEHPRYGDPIRGLVTSGLIPGASGRNFFVEHLGATSAASASISGTRTRRALLDRLIARADVFLTSFLDDARSAAHRGTTCARSAAADLRPRIRPGTPRSRRAAAAATTGSPSGRAAASPIACPPPASHRSSSAAFGDFIGGMAIAGGIAAALFQRERTSEGSRGRRLAPRHRALGAVARTSTAAALRLRLHAARCWRHAERAESLVAPTSVPTAETSSS
jgi:crotonobetainyl-CoA:carnitine CoA-transferase CaiB-like acyl-CoA transferase